MLTFVKCSQAILYTITVTGTYTVWPHTHVHYTCSLHMFTTGIRQRHILSILNLAGSYWMCCWYPRCQSVRVYLCQVPIKCHCQHQSVADPRFDNSWGGVEGGFGGTNTQTSLGGSGGKNKIGKRLEMVHSRYILIRGAVLGCVRRALLPPGSATVSLSVSPVIFHSSNCSTGNTSLISLWSRHRNPLTSHFSGYFEIYISVYVLLDKYRAASWSLLTVSLGPSHWPSILVLFPSGSQGFYPVTGITCPFKCHLANWGHTTAGTDLLASSYF